MSVSFPFAIPNMEGPPKKEKLVSFPFHLYFGNSNELIELRSVRKVWAKLVNRKKKENRQKMEDLISSGVLKTLNEKGTNITIVDIVPSSSASSSLSSNGEEIRRTPRTPDNVVERIPLPIREPTPPPERGGPHVATSTMVTTNLVQNENELINPANPTTLWDLVRFLISPAIGVPTLCIEVFIQKDEKEEENGDNSNLDLLPMDTPILELGDTNFVPKLRVMVNAEFLSGGDMDVAEGTEDSTPLDETQTNERVLRKLRRQWWYTLTHDESDSVDVEHTHLPLLLGLPELDNLDADMVKCNAESGFYPAMYDTVLKSCSSMKSATSSERVSYLESISAKKKEFYQLASKRLMETPSNKGDFPSFHQLTQCNDSNDRITTSSHIYNDISPFASMWIRDLVYTNIVDAICSNREAGNNAERTCSKRHAGSSSKDHRHESSTIVGSMEDDDYDEDQGQLSHMGFIHLYSQTITSLGPHLLIPRHYERYDARSEHNKTSAMKSVERHRVNHKIKQHAFSHCSVLRAAINANDLFGVQLILLESNEIAKFHESEYKPYDQIATEALSLSKRSSLGDIVDTLPNLGAGLSGLKSEAILNRLVDSDGPENAGESNAEQFHIATPDLSARTDNGKNKESSDTNAQQFNIATPSPSSNHSSSDSEVGTEVATARNGENPNSAINTLQNPNSARSSVLTASRASLTASRMSLPYAKDCFGNVIQKIVPLHYAEVSREFDYACKIGRVEIARWMLQHEDLLKECIYLSNEEQLLRENGELPPLCSIESAFDYCIHPCIDGEMFYMVLEENGRRKEFNRRMGINDDTNLNSSKEEDQIYVGLCSPADTTPCIESAGGSDPQMVAAGTIQNSNSNKVLMVNPFHRESINFNVPRRFLENDKGNKYSIPHTALSKVMLDIMIMESTTSVDSDSIINRDSSKFLLSLLKEDTVNINAFFNGAYFDGAYALEESERLDGRIHHVEDQDITMDYNSAIIVPAIPGKKSSQPIKHSNQLISNNLNLKLYHPNTILHLLAFSGCLDYMQMVFDHKGKEINVDVANPLGFTPIFYAAARGLADTVQVLLENDANPTIVDSYGYNCLHASCLSFCNTQIIKSLTIDYHSPYVHDVIDFPQTVENLLTWSTQSGQQWLGAPRRGIDLNVRCKLGLTPLDMSRRNVEYAKAKCKTDGNSVDQNGLLLLIAKRVNSLLLREYYFGESILRRYVMKDLIRVNDSIQADVQHQREDSNHNTTPWSSTSSLLPAGAASSRGNYSPPALEQIIQSKQVTLRKLDSFLAIEARDILATPGYKMLVYFLRRYLVDYEALDVSEYEHAVGMPLQILSESSTNNDDKCELQMSAFPVDAEIISYYDISTFLDRHGKPLLHTMMSRYTGGENILHYICRTKALFSHKLLELILYLVQGDDGKGAIFLEGESKECFGILEGLGPLILSESDSDQKKDISVVGAAERTDDSSREKETPTSSFFGGFLTGKMKSSEEISKTEETEMTRKKNSKQRKRSSLNSLPISEERARRGVTQVFSQMVKNGDKNSLKGIGSVTRKTENDEGQESRRISKSPFSIELVSFLNAQNYECNTPLHLALLAGNTDIAKFLLSLDVDIDLPNLDGKTAFELMHELPDMKEILQYLAARLGNDRNIDNDTMKKDVESDETYAHLSRVPVIAGLEEADVNQGIENGQVGMPGRIGSKGERIELSTQNSGIGSYYNQSVRDSAARHNLNSYPHDQSYMSYGAGSMMLSYNMNTSHSTSNAHFIQRSNEHGQNPHYRITSTLPQIVDEDDNDHPENPDFTYGYVNRQYSPESENTIEYNTQEPRIESWHTELRDSESKPPDSEQSTDSKPQDSLDRRLSKRLSQSTQKLNSREIDPRISLFQSLIPITGLGILFLGQNITHEMYKPTGERNFSANHLCRMFLKSFELSLSNMVTCFRDRTGNGIIADAPGIIATTSVAISTAYALVGLTSFLFHTVKKGMGFEIWVDPSSQGGENRRLRSSKHYKGPAEIQKSAQKNRDSLRSTIDIDSQRGSQGETRLRSSVSQNQLKQQLNIQQAKPTSGGGVQYFDPNGKLVDPYAV